MLLLRVLMFWVVAVLCPSAALAAAYEAHLPPELFSDPQLCKYTDCATVLPGADRFGSRMGQPHYVEAFAGQRKVGYVFLSTDISDIPAYSGKPVITLMGMDLAGKITGVRILKHSEPILLLGIPEAKLLAFVGQYLGHPATAQFEIGRAADRSADVVTLDAISGATVTVIAENQLVSRCAYEVARQVGLIRVQALPQARFLDSGQLLDWTQLQAAGAVQPLEVSAGQVGVAETGKPYIQLWFAYLNHPLIGRSLLGADAYQKLMLSLRAGDHAIMVINDGAASFKGSGFVRGGIYDRIQVKQGRSSFTFRDTDYLNLYSVQAAAHPTFHESGIFIVRGGQQFSAAYPWQFVFMGNKQDKDSGSRVFANFEQEYWLAAAYLQGGRPTVQRPDPAWLKVWKSRALEISLFSAFLLVVAAFFATRDRWVRLARRSDKRWIAIPKYAAWLISIAFVGFYALAQPSVTQVLTWVHSLVYEWRWELFLSDPFIFIFWWFIFLTTFVWGRGLFCGWLCPYGSLSELLYKAAGRLGLRRWQRPVPAWLHNKLKWLKYFIFAGLLLVSFYSMSLAEQLAEVEPFKTTFLVGFWNRSWPFVGYLALLLGLSLFIERPFCKYLCPLGASLGVPSRWRLLPLRRKAECGPCRACAVGCGSQAIGEDGRIDSQECLQCLDCMVMYYDAHACPPLAKERKARQKAGQPLTGIAGNGYYIPLRKVD